MCGRFAQGDMEAIYSKYRVKISKNLKKQLKPRYNIAPQQQVPIVVEKEHNNVIKQMKWGFIPHWADDEKFGSKIINARAETVNQKPAFKTSFVSRRCIVPATGFYEWQESENEKSKTPYFIYPSDEKVFSLAGIYDIWKDSQGKQRHTFAILTTDSTRSLKHIHHRMPVILQEKEDSIWLEKDSSEDKLISVLDKYPSKKLAKHKVSKKVNNPRNDVKEVTKPFN